MRRIFAILALAGFAGPALACINDIELPKYEREFRSQYKNTTPPAAEPSSSEPNRHYLMFGAGGAMLVGATVMTLRRRAS